MFKKYLSLALVSLMLCGVNLPIISAQSITDNSIERNRLEKIKTEVYRFGLGEKSKVIVKLKDGTQLKGYISQTIENSFDLTDAKTKQFTTIPYRDVAQIKEQGRSIRTKLAFDLGVAALIIVIVAIKGTRSSGVCPLGCK